MMTSQNKSFKTLNTRKGLSDISLMLNLKNIFFALLLLLLSSCKSSQPQNKEADIPSIEDETEQIAPVDEIKVFIFGNSLVVHEHTPQPSEEKKVPHWIELLTRERSLNFSVDGEYGFLRQFADFSDIQAQWGFTEVSSIWTEETAPFSSLDYNSIILTPANFIQYQEPNMDYYDEPGVTPLSASLNVYDQSVSAHPQAHFYIYEGWADMGSYGEFPNSVDFSRYNQDATSGFYANWFLNYHDALLAARPESSIKMIPVSRVLSHLFQESALNSLTVAELYEDNAPHGEATIYFLASLVTYMSLYKQTAPESFNVPTTVHTAVRENYEEVINFIWEDLQNFNHEDGTSRVF